MNQSLCFFSLLTLATACQSREQSAADQLVAAAELTAQSPEAQARAQAWQAATTLPPDRPTSALDLRAGVEQMLPADGPLELVTATAHELQPVILALPALWGSPKAGYPGVAPGYRILYTAELRYHPSNPASSPAVPLYCPTGPDTLASFRVGYYTGRGHYEVRKIRPAQVLTVHGMLYTYLGQNNHQQPALVVYPYRSAGNLVNQKLVLLPLSQ